MCLTPARQVVMVIGLTLTARVGVKLWAASGSGADRLGRWSHFATALYISMVILYTEYLYRVASG
jgi:hypothetical protein